MQWCFFAFSRSTHRARAFTAQVVFKPPKAIRGGIPLCFPQFSDFGPLGQHGFARNQEWEIVTERTSSETVTMRLASTEATLESWPHRFECTYKVSLEGDELVTDLTVANHNQGAEPMTFTTALHTYFKVADASKARVEGLKGTKYLDSLKKREKFDETGDAVTFAEEVDRIYLATPDALQIVDPTGGKTVTLAKTGLPDAVVWNPWVDKSRATGDLGDEDYKEMVCVEAAAIDTPVVVHAGETWTCRQKLSVSRS